MFGTGKRGEAKPATAEAKSAGPARAVEEIDDEINKLTKSDRAEKERLQRIEQLRRERERSINEAEETERQAQLAALMPVLERHRASWLKQISAVDDAMRALMRQFADTLRHGSAIRRTEYQIQNLGGKFTPVRGIKSHFLDYFTYPKMMALWKEIRPADRGPAAENQPLKTA